MYRLKKEKEGAKRERERGEKQKRKTKMLQKLGENYPPNSALLT